MRDQTDIIYHPRFIAFEGIDGSGKGTQIQMLADRLTTAGHDVMIVRDPGGNPVSKDIRSILTNPSDEYAIAPATQAMLFTASRIETMRRITIPHLDKGGVVLNDRFIASTIAMQGYASRLLQPEPDPLPLAEYLCSQILIRPAQTIFLDIPVEISLQRVRTRGNQQDHFEKSSIAYHTEIAQRMPDIIRATTRRMIRINANRPASTIAEHIASSVELAPH